MKNKDIKSYTITIIILAVLLVLEIFFRTDLSTLNTAEQRSNDARISKLEKQLNELQELQDKYVNHTHRYFDGRIN